MNGASLDTIFDPFSSENDTENNNNTFSYDTFENIRLACEFHLPKDIQHVITNNQDKLNIMHVNARSILKKLDALCTLITQTAVKWHFVSVSETWLSKNIEQDYNVPGFKAFFCSRELGGGGGSALYISDQLSPCQLDIPPFTTAEAITVSIQFSKNISIAFCQVFRAPRTDRYQFINELEKCLIYLNKLKKTVLITGDFNFDLFSVETSLPTQTFFNTLLSHGFFPTISRTTRSDHPSYTLLENIFCNDLSKVMHSGVVLNDLSDHFPIFTSLRFNVSSEGKNKKPNTQIIFNYSKIEEFKLYLSENLENVMDESDPNIIADKITKVYQEGINKFSSTKRLSRKNDPRKPWMTSAIIHSISHKDALFKEKLRHPSAQNIEKYNQYRNILTTLIRSAKRQYFQGEFAKHSSSPKETWKTLQNLIKSRQKIDEVPTQFLSENGEIFSKDVEVAESFNNFFAEIGERLKGSIPSSSLDPLKLILNIDEEMELGATSELEIINIVRGLNNVGAGVDNINSKLFKASYQTIIKHLLHLFNTCLETGIFPSCFKMAVIKPIFKSGDCSLINNYRPISILPIMSKILEKLIHHRLITHVNQHDIIHENQFGFQKINQRLCPFFSFKSL